MASPADHDASRPEPPPAGGRRPVLVLGTDDWAVEQAVTVLSEAGHEVLTCHPPGQPAFPCNALVQGRTCPLDVGFDVVVNIRARPVDIPTLGEIGVVCGLHAGAALVTAGMGGRNPFAGWATRTVGEGNDLSAVVGEVLAARAQATTAIEADLRERATLDLADDPRPASSSSNE
jgi:hypothetical protein